jgi:hypothetical protein
MGILSETVKVGIFLALLFTAYISYQNIITLIYKQLNLPNLGKYNLFMVYGFFMLTNFVAPFVAKRIKYKSLLIIASLCYAINLMSGLATQYLEN